MPFLHAQLNDRHGSVQSASVDLGECIQNEAGKLEYLGSDLSEQPVSYDAGV